MKYAIKKGKKYYANSGLTKSDYTTVLEKARIYDDRNTAVADIVHPSEKIVGVKFVEVEIG